jgi:hypothetical protein
MKARKVTYGLLLIGLGVLLGFFVFGEIALHHGDSLASDHFDVVWDARDTGWVLFYGSLAFVPGVLLVVWGFRADATESRWGPRIKAGISLLIVGATYSLVAWGLLGRVVSWAILTGNDDGLTGYDAPPVPGKEYVFAALIGGIPLLLGVALLALGPIRRALPPSPGGTKGPPPAAPGACA